VKARSSKLGILCVAVAMLVGVWALPASAQTTPSVPGHTYVQNAQRAYHPIFHQQDYNDGAVGNLFGSGDNYCASQLALCGSAEFMCAKGVAAPCSLLTTGAADGGMVAGGTCTGGVKPQATGVGSRVDLSAPWSVRWRCIYAFPDGDPNFPNGLLGGKAPYDLIIYMSQNVAGQNGLVAAQCHRSSRTSDVVTGMFEPSSPTGEWYFFASKFTMANGRKIWVAWAQFVCDYVAAPTTTTTVCSGWTNNLLNPNGTSNVAYRFHVRTGCSKLYGFEGVDNFPQKVQGACAYVLEGETHRCIVESVTTYDVQQWPTTYPVGGGSLLSVAQTGGACASATYTARKMDGTFLASATLTAPEAYVITFGLGDGVRITTSGVPDSATVSYRIHEGRFNNPVGSWDYVSPPGASRDYVVVPKVAGQDVLEVKCEVPGAVALWWLSKPPGTGTTFVPPGSAGTAGVSACVSAIGGGILDALNPTSYVTATGCILRYLFVPTSRLQDSLTSLSAALDNSVIGEIEDALGNPIAAVSSMEDWSTACEGPTLALPSVGNVQPLNGCGAEITIWRERVITITGAFFRIGAVLACARLVQGAIGIHLGTEEAQK